MAEKHWTKWAIMELREFVHQLLPIVSCCFQEVLSKKVGKQVWYRQLWVSFTSYWAGAGCSTKDKGHIDKSCFPPPPTSPTQETLSKHTHLRLHTQARCVTPLGDKRAWFKTSWIIARPQLPVYTDGLFCFSCHCERSGWGRYCSRKRGACVDLRPHLSVTKLVFP